ncbi:MAG: proline racemase family protein [Candidatus Bathyarchaeia archaeon]
MKFSRMVMTVDAHTMGEPVRVVICGVPSLPGKSMAEKQSYFAANLNDVHRALILEPRGHKDMFGAVLTSPTRDDCDFGVIFLDNAGFEDMCIHGTIGVAKVLIETGLVQPHEPVTEIGLDTSAGRVVAKAKVEGGAVKEVTVLNVPSFLAHSHVKIEIPEVGSIPVDVAFGGNFFAIVDAKNLGIKVKLENIDRIVKLGLLIRNLVNEKIKVEHPLSRHINRVNLVEICDEPEDPKATYRNAVVFGAGQVDRSPCGTGTSAKMAALYAKGLLKINEQIISESIIGTHFKGRLVAETKIGDFNAVIPEISGQAYVTGFHQFVVDPEDPVKYGFLL